jgi:hypothetical protein
MGKGLELLAERNFGNSLGDGADERGVEPMMKFVAALCASVALSGCAGSSRFMTKVAPGAPPVAPVPGQATIVFVRDSGLAFAVNFAILDQSGRFYGESVAKSNFAVRVPAGRFFFLARAFENADIVRATVEPGRLYFIRVIPKFGVILARVTLDPIKPTEPDWEKLPAWIEQSNKLVPLLGASTGFGVTETESGSEANPLERFWSSLSSDEQGARTIEPVDGTKLPLGPTRLASN